MQFLANLDWALIFAVLFGLSEVLGMIPSVEANGVFHAIANVIKFVHEKVFPPKPAQASQLEQPSQPPQQ